MAKHGPIINTLKGGGVDHYIFQLEKTGEDNWHYQGYFHTIKKHRVQELKIIREGMGGIHITPASSEGKEALKGYCMKEETRQAGPWADKVIYLGADLITTLRPWQTWLHGKLLEEIDNRSIMWLYNPGGNAGKSVFIKYMCVKHDAGFLMRGQAKDLLEGVFKQPHKKMYLVNMTMSKPKDMEDADLYATLECIKDGIFMKQKYDVSIHTQMPSHVVVFANFLPYLGAVALDRWRVHRYVEEVGGLPALWQPMSSKQVMQAQFNMKVEKAVALKTYNDDFKNAVAEGVKRKRGEGVQTLEEMPPDEWWGYYPPSYAVADGRWW
jgi:hypothetical protein